MTAFRIYFAGDRVGPKFQRVTQAQGARVLASMRGAAEDVRAEALDQGRADIKKAGKFGTRWTAGLQGTISEGGGNIRLAFTHSEIGFNVHQYGATIAAKNPTGLLWIPLSFAGIAPGQRAAGFPGGLFRVDRKTGGAPLLLSRVDKQPKFFGKASVRIPKRFHVIEIIRATAQKMQTFYSARFKASG